MKQKVVKDEGSDPDEVAIEQMGPKQTYDYAGKPIDIENINYEKLPTHWAKSKFKVMNRGSNKSSNAGSPRHKDQKEAALTTKPDMNNLKKILQEANLAARSSQNKSQKQQHSVGGHTLNISANIQVKNGVLYKTTGRNGEKVTLKNDGAEDYEQKILHNTIQSG